MLGPNQRQVFESPRVTRDHPLLLHGLTNVVLHRLLLLLELGQELVGPKVLLHVLVNHWPLEAFVCAQVLASTKVFALEQTNIQLLLAVLYLVFYQILVAFGLNIMAHIGSSRGTKNRSQRPRIDLVLQIVKFQNFQVNLVYEDPCHC